MVINSDEGTGKGEGLSVGCEDGGVNDSGGWNPEGDDDQDNAEHCQQKGENDLGFHLLMSFRAKRRFLLN